MSSNDIKLTSLRPLKHPEDVSADSNYGSQDTIDPGTENGPSKPVAFDNVALEVDDGATEKQLTDIQVCFTIIHG